MGVEAIGDSPALPALLASRRAAGAVLTMTVCPPLGVCPVPLHLAVGSDHRCSRVVRSRARRLRRANRAVQGRRGPWLAVEAIGDSDSGAGPCCARAGWLDWMVR